MPDVAAQIQELEAAGRFNEAIPLKLQLHREQMAEQKASDGKISAGKTLFLPDFQRLEQSMEKQLVDPNIPAEQRVLISHRLTSLKYRWQTEGVGDVSVIIAIRDNLRSTPAEFGKAGLGDTSVADAHRTKLAEAERIIAEAKAKGLI